MKIATYFLFNSKNVDYISLEVIMLRSRFNLFATLIGLLISFSVGAQITTTNLAPYNTANNLVNNVLLGNGVQAFNVQVYGAPIQYGFFDNGANSIGLDSGLVLITGDINEVPIPPGFAGTIPIGLNSGNWGPTAMGNATNNDLLSIANSVPPLINQTFSISSANDACVIEFDFIPTSDSIEFRYVFASDEYTTWINSQYNDVFAFLLSGPGITGSYTSPPGFPGGSKNLAIVPQSNPQLPITISSVQPALNSMYYVSNIPNSNISMNGYTTVLTVKEAVVPCDTFHIRLAIADGSDHALSSAVFLEANSFKSRGISVVAEPTYNSVGGDSIIFEGCGGVNLTFTRQTNISNLDTVILNIGGTATNGLDYSQINDTLFFNPGQDSLSIYFDVFNDNIAEGIETFFLEVINTTACFSNGNDTLILEIFDPLPLNVTVSNDTTVDCTVDSLQLFASGTGLLPITHVWQNGDTSNQISTGPIQTSSFIVTSYDACAIDSTLDTIVITEYTPPFQTVSLLDTISCITDSVLIGTRVINGYPDITYQWSNGRLDSAIWVKSQVDTSFFVTVSLGCSGQFEEDTFSLTVQNAPFTISMKDDTMDCTIDSILLGPSLNSTVHGFTYQWANGKTDSAIWVNPDQNTIYNVSVTDACGLVTQGISSMVFFENTPMVLTTNSPVFECIGDSVELKVSAIGGHPGYLYMWDNGHIGPSQWVTLNQSKTYAVLVTDTCRSDTVLGWVDVTFRNYPPFKIENIPSPFLNCPGDTVVLGPAKAIGGSGDYSVTWTNWVDTFSTKIVSTDSTSLYIVKARDNCDLDSTQRVVTVGIQKHDPLQLEVSKNQQICVNGEVDLYAEASDGAGFYTYRWSTGSNDTSIHVAPPYTTAYGVTVTDDCGNQRFDNVRVRVQKPTANFNYAYVDDREVKFANLSSNDVVSYYWEFANGDTSTLREPTYSNPLPFEYTVKLIVENAIGCVDSALLEVEKPLQIFVPNSFSPNGDGLNDQFVLGIQGVKDFQFFIYDRWGNQLFETRDPDFIWEGKLNEEPLQQGVYVYRVKVEGINKQVVEKKGSIMLIRN